MSKVQNHRFGLVGLCITAACALMAFGASAAQAAAPEWMLNGVNVASNTTVDATLTPELVQYQNGAGTHDVNAVILLAKTSLGAPLWIACKKAGGTGITLEAAGKAKGTIELKECSTSLLNASKQMILTPLCNPQATIKAGWQVSLVLSGGAELAKFEGTGGGSFTTLEFPNEECSLNGQKYAVGGWTYFRDCLGKFSTELLSHLIEEDMASALAAGGGLTWGVNVMSLDGSAILEVFQSGAMKTFAGLA